MTNKNTNNTYTSEGTKHKSQEMEQTINNKTIKNEQNLK